MQSLNTAEISALIQKRLETLEPNPSYHTEGVLISVKDGIVQLSGLESAVLGELIELDEQTYGLALNLEQETLGAVVLGPYEHLREGQIVKGTGRVLDVPVGEALLGQIVDPLGRRLDNATLVQTSLRFPIERPAPGVMARQSVDQPLQTGIKAIDAMVPIGRGQRELIIGDRQTGKTSLAIDTIINQRDTGVKCIYVAIGQKASAIAQVAKKLAEKDALQHTIIVAASASEAAALQFIAPYAACSMGEYFRDRGKDALIVYDDLTKHAWAWRQISLLLRRPPGREAYPGDIFYIHSRLLERAARVNAQQVEQATEGKIKGKTGSLTALPILETQAGDISAFVPTNVISITDGQIFLETDLFNAGVRPAINPGLSVSRVGGAAQTHLIKKLGAGVRLSLAQYRELAAFSQFMSDLDPATRQQLERGQRVTEILKQVNNHPLSVAEMAVSLFTVNHGFLDDIPLNQVLRFEQQLFLRIRSLHAALLKQINQKLILDELLITELTQILSNFKANWHL
jgi:F-type H+/Na+-transporting ATPase subunit alpha